MFVSKFLNQESAKLFSATLLVAVLLLSSCSPKKQFKPSSSETKIKVTTSSNQSGQLIKRIYFSKTEVESLLANWHPEVVMRYKVLKEEDAYGNSMGLRVLACKPNCASSKIGLQIGDVLTAAGRRHISQINDLIFLFERLLEKGVASLTLQRDRLPRKFYYHLGESRADSGKIS